jgi:hypothetical protein
VVAVGIGDRKFVEVHKFGRHPTVFLFDQDEERMQGVTIRPA